MQCHTHSLGYMYTQSTPTDNTSTCIKQQYDNVAPYWLELSCIVLDYLYSMDTTLNVSVLISTSSWKKGITKHKNEAACPHVF